MQRTADDPRFAELVDALRRAAEAVRPQPEVEPEGNVAPLRHPLAGAA
jgi:hypothetical protein